MIYHIRFHGRGGEGVKLAGRIVTRVAFSAGFRVQDSPLYGAERRGAPVVAFARVADRAILERGYIDTPDALVIMDASLLAHPEAAVLDGVAPATLVVANSPLAAEELQARYGIRGRVVSVDVSSIALALLGQHLLSAPIAGVTAKVLGLGTWDQVAAAAGIELAAAGVTPALIDRNRAATERAFAAAPALASLRERPAPPRARTAGGTPAAALFVVPHLPARVAAPSIAAVTSVRRTMEGWRVYRPVVQRPRCTRCFMCFALCPEGAIQLDAENYPVVDYAHCKGCLVCVAECPPQAISQVREEAAA